VPVLKPEIKERQADWRKLELLNGYVTTLDLTWPEKKKKRENMSVAYSGFIGVRETQQPSPNNPMAQVVDGGVTQSIANATPTIVAFPSGTYGVPSSNGAIYYNASSGVFSVADSGCYLCSATVFWSTSNTTGDRYAWIGHNGINFEAAGSYGYQGEGSIKTGGDYSIQSVCVPVLCVAGDTLALCVSQSSGGALNVGGFPPHQFSIVQLFWWEKNEG
jgi:hypothetical protein